MSRKRIGSHARKRGRPRKANAKRRATTRIGWRTGRDPVDLGTEELMARKKIAANGSGAAVELVDYPPSCWPIIRLARKTR